MAYTPNENITDSVGLMQWINNSATINGDGILFPGMIMSVFAIMLIKQLTNQNNSASNAFGAASFIAMILSVFGRLLGLISTAFMSIWIALTALAAIWMFMENR